MAAIRASVFADGNLSASQEPPAPRAVSALDEEDAAIAAFSQPTPDGRFDDEAIAFMGSLAARRRSVILAFAPKAAGTFFRSAAIDAIDGQLVRTVHAQGERDAQFYLPTFLSYYLDKLTPSTMVTHVHMQAFTANRHFIEALDLKPVIMVRPIADMLTSYWDMLEQDSESRHEGLNCRIAPDFDALPRDAQADFLVDILGPWYANYFATWFDYADIAPQRVCVLDYGAFVADPAEALRTALAHAGLPRSCEDCQAAIEANWSQRESMRFNRGVSGRGRDRFSASHFARLERMLGYYRLSPRRMADLLGH